MELRLDPAEKNAVLDALLATGIADEQTCRAGLDGCRLIHRRPSLHEIRGPRSMIAYVALKTRATGITLGDRVFFRQDCCGPDDRPPLDLVAHELAHVVQFRRDGPSRFLMRYMLDYARNLARGMPEREAYLAIPYEEEARAVEAALRATTTD